jgi:hypothetical protein
MEVPCMGSIDDIPNLCTYYVRCLDAQPLCNVFYRSGIKIAKVGVFAERSDCGIFALLHLNVRNICDDSWGIVIFGEADPCWALNEYSYRELGTGMLLLNEKIDLDKLQALYDKLINGAKQGWRVSTIQGNPDIAIKKLERQWVLCVKQERLDRESELINFLIQRFELDEKVQCNNKWVSELGAVETRGDLYLWIEKSAFSQFEARFKFGLEPLPNDDDYIEAE